VIAEAHPTAVRYSLGGLLAFGALNALAAFVVLGWLIVQMGIIGYVSWMQPATAIAGLLMLILGSQLPLRERIAPVTTTRERLGTTRGEGLEQ